MQRLRPHLTYANLIATLALFFALASGGAYAATKLAPKSVGETQLRPGAVTAEKIRKQAVITPKIKAGAVNTAKLANSAVSEAKLAPAVVTNSKLADNSVSTAKLLDGSVTGAKVEESSLGTVPSATRAAFAAEAEVANPAAFAKVETDGSIDASLSRGIAAVAQGKEPGIYCVEVAAFNPRGAQVTPQFNGTGTISAFVAVGGPGCPAPALEVQIRSGGALAKGPFYVVAYR